MGKKEKKELRQKVAATLTTTFPGLGGEISPKKLKRNIKNASKALLEGITVKTEESPETEKGSKKKKRV